MKLLAILLFSFLPAISSAQTTFTGTPDPFTPDSNGLGQITLTWSAPVASVIEIRVSSPTGALLAKYGNAGSGPTGQWVTDGLQFYLQDVSNGEPGSTLATYTAHGGWHGLPERIPSLVSIENGQQLVFKAPGATEVEIHVNKPWGPLFARFFGDLGSATTGPWIRDGMRFYLQDVSNGQPLTLQHTLATAIATVDETTPGKQGVTFGATPGLISDPGNTGLGSATLFWNAPGYSAVEVHVDSPDGPLFARTGPNGLQSSGNWITDGMRFYLQDMSSGTVTSPDNTLAIATVDLQPSHQHFLSYYKSDGGVLTYSGDSMHLLGQIPPTSLPAGVTAKDMHPSLDGTLLYLLGSDSNYYMLDPAADSVMTSFAAGSLATSFGVMKGPLKQDLLILAPDNQGNIAIVDPAQRIVTTTLNCPCYGSVSGILVNPGTGAAFFVSVAPASTSNPGMPVPGVSGMVLYSVSASLQLGTPYPLPYPPTWSGSTLNAGATFLILNAGAHGTLLVTWTQLKSYLFPNVPTDLIAYDVATRTMTTLTQAFTLASQLNVPRLASADGMSIYAQPLVLSGVGPDQRGTLLPGDLSLFQATPTAPQPFSWEAIFPLDNQPNTLLPYLALNDRYIFFGQSNVTGLQPNQWGSFYLYRANRSTLQPVGFERIPVDDTVSTIIGPVTGAYVWPVL